MTQILRIILIAVFLMCSTSAKNGDAEQSVSQDEKVLVFVGTYSRDEGWVNGTGKGVHVFSFSTAGGYLTPVGAKRFGDNPTFLAGLSKKRRVIYATNEVSANSTLKPGTTTGFVYAISYDTSGTMTELNHVESGGAGATHIAVSPNEDYIAVSNYGGGSVSVFPVLPNGGLGAATDFHQYVNGSKVLPNQEAPHIHSTTWAGKGSTGAFSADLGNDRVAQFNLDAKSGKLVVNPTNEFIKRPPGSGPRHMTIHPSKKFAYVVSEMSNTIGVYKLDIKAGTLSTESLQEMSTLPADFKGKSTSADIHTSEDGKFLYSSNRGHDSIAMFRIGSDGKLTALGHESTRGKIPRNFKLYKNFLIVANQGTNNIEVFRVNPDTGMLSYTDNSAECGTPVNIFIPRQH